MIFDRGGGNSIILLIYTPEFESVRLTLTQGYIFFLVGGWGI